jgi:hypothetical protein
MVANISEFLNSFPKEVARPYNFTVNITGPIISPFDTRSLSFRCEGSELPSRTFSLVEQKTYGPVQYFPVQNFYEKVNLTFICSDDMREKELFDSWMDIMSNAATNTPEGVQFDFEYKDNYRGTVEIIQYDLAGKESYKARLFEAFPISVHPMKLDWAAANEVHKLMVTFAYRYLQK